MGLTGEPLVILGTFRGGTSCLATAAAALGYYLGAEKDFDPEDEFNPGGYWELREQTDFHTKALETFGLNFFSPISIPPDWQDFPTTPDIVARLRKLMRKHFDGREHWGWKEPATTVLVPLYEEAFKHEGVASPRYPIMIRHPLSVVASQEKRQSSWGYTAELTSPLGRQQAIGERAMGVWVHYALCSLRDTKGRIRQMISYEGFLQDPRPYVERMVDGLLGWTPGKDQIEAAIATVNPSWSHSKYSVDDLKGWPSIVARVYDCCLRADGDHEGLNSGKFDDEVDGLWKEWSVTTDMVRTPLLPVAEMSFSWQGVRGIERRSKKYSPTASTQVIRIELPAPPGALIQIDPHQMPCQLLIREAVWKVGGKKLPVGFKPGPEWSPGRPGRALSQRLWTRSSYDSGAGRSGIGRAGIRVQCAHRGGGADGNRG